MASPALSEVGRITSVVLKHAKDAFVDADTAAAQWKELNFTALPDVGRAVDEYELFLDLLRSTGAQLHFLPPDHRTTLDSIYVRDASVVCPNGVILCSMGKHARAAEPDAQQATLRSLAGIKIVGRVAPPGRLEGGDVVWLDAQTLIVGRGYRTNAEGIRQLRGFVGEAVHVIEIPLPHWRGEGDVMHLMSLISPVGKDIAVVYSRLLPVPFREWLLERGITLIEVPDAEFESMGTNVLALAPQRCVLLAGNPRTRAALEHAGIEALEYEGTEISVKGKGGPTCLTRPINRES